MTEEIATPALSAPPETMAGNWVICPHCSQPRDPITFTPSGSCTLCLIEQSRVETPIVIGWDDVRDLRNQILSGSDFSQLADQLPSVREAWQPFRVQLRDVTDDHASPQEAWDWLNSVRYFRPDQELSEGGA